MEYKSKDFKYFVEETTAFKSGNYRGILVNTDIDNKYRATFGHKGVGCDYNVEYDSLLELAHDIVLFAKNNNISNFDIGIHVTLPLMYPIINTEFLISLYSKELEQLEGLVNQTSLYCFSTVDRLIKLTYEEALDFFSNENVLTLLEVIKCKRV